jgi:transcription elongation factor Elf1
MKNFSFLKDVLRRGFGELRDKKSSDQVQINCPHCAKLYNNYEPDNKFNLEINLSKRVYKCWKCEISGPIPKLLKYYTKKDIYNLYIDNFDDFDYINTYKSDEDEDLYREVLLPKEYIPFSRVQTVIPMHNRAYNYITKERKIKDRVLKELNIGFCVEGYYENRIIIPSYDINGKLNYYITRTFVNDKVTYLKPKINQDFIFNENRIDWSSTLYVVEGGFDYLSLHFNTLCLLGKEFIPYVFDKVVKYKPPLVFVLDPDAMKQTIKYINIFDNMSINMIKFVELPNNTDIDDLSKRIGLNNLSQYFLENSKYLTDEEIIKYQT